MTENDASNTEIKRCSYCDHEGEPGHADYYGTTIVVCPKCGCEYD